MPASKVRRTAKARIPAGRKRIREQDSSCAGPCCPREASGIGSSKPRPGQLSVATQDQTWPATGSA
jgi:hypothetical protein